MISGPLAEWLGFSTFFLVVMFASVPSVWAACAAPFPLEGDEHKGSSDDEAVGIFITPDDPTRLSEAEQKVQRTAGRASVYAMINILVILILDAKFLGSLQGKASGNGRIEFGLLVGCALFKFFLSLRTYKFARQAWAESSACPDNAYLANARGAKIATWICASVTAVILFAGYKLGM
jgi:PAT family beta-lactamase induction signal transducer AmpG